MKAAVLVYHDPNSLGVNDLHDLSIVRILQQAVAGAMHCGDDPNGNLAPGDVAVRQFVPVAGRPLRFEVYVDWLAAREANFSEREARLHELVRLQLPEDQGFELQATLVPADSLVPDPKSE